MAYRYICVWNGVVVININRKDKCCYQIEKIGQSDIITIVYVYGTCIFV